MGGQYSVGHRTIAWPEGNPKRDETSRYVSGNRPQQKKKTPNLTPPPPKKNNNNQPWPSVWNCNQFRRRGKMKCSEGGGSTMAFLEALPRLATVPKMQVSRSGPLRVDSVQVIMTQRAIQPDFD
ncbi:hypothetical protein LX36DRAFT_30108 [Colletotrichum falcatum]|nr:hypothetical protein LX36DRAFT_30108 [Colletotrichum falcatum]